MLTKFWESLGSNVAERWLEYIFGPVFFFWAGGFGLYVWKTGWQSVLNVIQALTPFQQGSWIILGLIILVFSSVFMRAIRFPILRLIEGYWPGPFRSLSAKIAAWRRPHYEKQYEELRRLASEDPESLDPGQRDKLIWLDMWAHWQPVRADDLLPTALGNILRARERSPERKYGLDAIVCWPRLWVLLPEHVRMDLANARASLDRLVEFLFLGLLFSLWSIWATRWALAISLVWMIVTYRLALQAAMIYGDLLETAFDLHRFSLYDAIGLRRPKDNQEEKALGKALTEYLWRGTLPGKLIYQSKPEDETTVSTPEGVTENRTANAVSSPASIFGQSATASGDIAGLQDRENYPPG